MPYQPHIFFDGRYHSSAINISTAVMDKLSGYAIIIVENVLLFGNTVYIQLLCFYFWFQNFFT